MYAATSCIERRIDIRIFREIVLAQTFARTITAF